MKLDEKKTTKYSEEGFSFLDQFFAGRLLKGQTTYSDKEFFFLCYLMAAFRSGHLCVKIEKEKVEPKLFLSEAVQEKVIRGSELFKEGDRGILIRSGDFFYLQKNWVLETEILESIHSLVKSPKSSAIDFSQAQEILDKKTQCKALLHEQAEAIRLSLDYSFMLVFGGPGTGKSYTAIQMMEVLSKAWQGKQKARVILIAPTGKAAMLLGEKVQSTSSALDCIEVRSATIHSILKIPYQIPENFEPQKIETDFIIVDESSMIDPKIMSYLLKAMPKSAHLVFMGDPDQLPSVEGGSIFADLKQIATNHQLPYHQILNQSVRFEKRLIFDFAESVNKGDYERVIELFAESSGDLTHHQIDRADDLIEMGINRYKELMCSEKDPVKYLEKIDQFRILSCLRHGPLGVKSINHRVFESLKSQSNEGAFFAPILIVQNDPNQSLYNGMVGVLVSSNRNLTKKGSFFEPEDQAYFLGEEGPFKLSLYALPQWEFAYSMSVHKSQGSEFEEVALLVPPGSDVFGRELFYTAATRAKRKLKICSSLETMKTILEKRTHKISGLATRWATD